MSDSSDPPSTKSPLSILPTHWPRLFNSIRGEFPRDELRAAEGEPVRVEGKLPPDLAGDFVAMGPALFTVLGRPVDSWFDGQGGMHRIRIQPDGSARFWSRIVRSQDFEDAMESRHQTVNHFAMNAPSVLPFHGVRTFNTSNTMALAWQGKLAGLYEGGVPVEVDSETLKTVGDWNPGGLMKKGEHLAAHWHYCPERKAIYDYGLWTHLGLEHIDEPSTAGDPADPSFTHRHHASTTSLRLYRFPDEGEAEVVAEVPIGGYPFLHDFIVSDNHAIFFIPPVTIDVVRLAEQLGTMADNFVWRPDKGVQVVIIDLNDPGNAARRRQFTIPPFWVWHYANAFEKDGQLHVDFILYDDYQEDVKPFLLTVHEGRYPATVSGSRLVRMSLDLDGDGLVVEKPYVPETLADVSCEFCRISPRAEARDYRYTWMAAHSSVDASHHCLWDTLAKVDVQARTWRRYTFGREQVPSEPIFVPRRDSEAEDDGYVLCLVYDGLTDRSYVAVLDGGLLESSGPNPEGEPAELPRGALLAKLHLPTSIPITFHRIWVENGVAR